MQYEPDPSNAALHASWCQCDICRMFDDTKNLESRLADVEAFAKYTASCLHKICDSLDDLGCAVAELKGYDWEQMKKKKEK